jgi:hypothetical protein
MAMTPFFLGRRFTGRRTGPVEFSGATRTRIPPGSRLEVRPKGVERTEPGLTGRRKETLHPFERDQPGGSSVGPAVYRPEFRRKIVRRRMNDGDERMPLMLDYGHPGGGSREGEDEPRREPGEQSNPDRPDRQTPPSTGKAEGRERRATLEAFEHAEPCFRSRRRVRSDHVNQTGVSRPPHSFLFWNDKAEGIHLGYRSSRYATCAGKRSNAEFGRCHCLTMRKEIPQNTASKLRDIFTGQNPSGFLNGRSYNVGSRNTNPGLAVQKARGC